MSTTLISTGITFPDNTTQTTAGNALGVGQTWQNMTGSRTNNVTYTNSTTKPIMVSVVGSAGNVPGDIQLSINGTLTQRQYTDPDSSNLIQTVWGIVVAGATYRITLSNMGVLSWHELR